MISKGKCVLRKRKEMLHEKLNQLANESRNIIELIHDIQIRATSIVSDLDLETDEREFLLKYPTTSKKLEKWQAQISQISYDLDVLVCEENRRVFEESNITSTTSRSKVEKALRTDDDVKSLTIPCPIQINDILDMRFVSGDSPHDFWLRFYSTKEVKEISSSIQKLFEANKLQCFKSSEMLAGDVCVCNGSDYFRGRIIKECTFLPMSYLIHNVDNGGVLSVERSKIYRLTKEVAKFPVQAINCCLEGVLGDPVLWDKCAVKLFHQVMMDSSLVVTICSVPTDTCSKFVVKVDTHNEMRVESKIDLCSWITYSVLPTLVQRRTSKSQDTLNLLFDFIRMRPELENSASMKENSTAVDHSSKPQDVEEKGDKDSRNLGAKGNGEEKSDMQQQPPPSNAAQECSSFLNFKSISALPLKDKPNVQEQPSNAVQDRNSFLNFSSTSAYAVPLHKDAEQQCSPFLSLSSSPTHAMPLHKEKTNAQQQSNSFLNFPKLQPLLSLPPHSEQYAPHVMPFQNPSPLFQLSPPPLINPPGYSYASEMPPPLLGLHPQQRDGPSVGLQQNQPQSSPLQISSSMQKRLLRKQQTSQKLLAARYKEFLQSITEDAQKRKECSTQMSLDDKQKEPASAIKQQTPSAGAESFAEDFPVKQQVSSPKVNSKNTNGMNKISLKYPNLKFETGRRYSAFVVHINNPDDFYIHVTCESTAFIETLDQEMTENYKTCSVKLKNKEQAKIMLYESWCAVFYEDGNLWHRGKVIDWKDDNDTLLEVQYVDYGEVREIDLSLIKPLKEEYTKLPICATRCRLANIHPPRFQEKSKHNIWPSETVELFKVLAVRDKLNSIVVTNCSSDPVSVLLVTEDNTVINKVLLDLEYAVAFKPIEFDPSLPVQVVKVEGEDEKPDGSALEKDTGNVTRQEDSLKNWDPMAEEYFSVDNTEYHDSENACYAVSGYVPQDEQRLCKFYAANGHCFKGVTCTKEHSLPNPDGWTTDRETVLLNPFSNLVLPSPGTLVSVEVTAIYSVNMFYAHILWEGRIKEDEETLLTLNKCINSKSNISKMKRPQVIPAVGQLVLARFMADGNSNFFRARVVDTSIEENKVQVVYIDYGNTEWVSKKDVREMEPQYLHLPFQAVECYISNVSPKVYSEEALLEVSDLILGKQLVGTLVSKNVLGHAEIELWDNDQKIADKLIEKDYAEYRESPLFLTDDASIIPG